MISKLFVAILLITALFVVSCSNTEKYIPFAQCLTEQNATMFGAYWCVHCINQKKAFGDSFQYVNYVECSLPNQGGQTEYCKQQGIKGYPTWEFKDGTRKSGEVAFEELSRLSGCPLPP